jgi:hypothetical protein
MTKSYPVALENAISGKMDLTTEMVTDIPEEEKAPSRRHDGQLLRLHKIRFFC